MGYRPDEADAGGKGTAVAITSTVNASSAGERAGRHGWDTGPDGSGIGLAW